MYRLLLSDPTLSLFHPALSGASMAKYANNQKQVIQIQPFCLSINNTLKYTIPYPILQDPNTLMP